MWQPLFLGIKYQYLLTKKSRYRVGSHSAAMVKMWQVAWHPQLKELVKSTGLEMKLTWGCSSALLLSSGVFGKSVPIPEPPFPPQSNGDF